MSKQHKQVLRLRIDSYIERLINLWFFPDFYCNSVGFQPKMSRILKSDIKNGLRDHINVHSMPTNIWSGLKDVTLVHISKSWSFYDFFLLCIKQVLSKFEPQNGEKNKQFLGLGQKSTCFLKKKVYVISVIYHLAIPNL